MDSFWVDFSISTIITVLRAAIKDPKRAAQVRNAMLKIAGLIVQVYGEEPVAAAAVKAVAKAKK